MDRLDVLVLGDANPDLILRGGDLAAVSGQREAVVEGAVLTVGGSGAIFACGAARLGLRVALVGVIGDDVFGGYIREELRSRGVDVGGLVVRTGRPTGVSVVLSRGGDRGTYTAPGTIAELRAEDIDVSLLAAARHIHVSSFFLQDALRSELAGLLDGARSSGSTTSLDPNWDPSEMWDGGILDVLHRVDVFLPNATEATRIAATQDVEAAVQVLAGACRMVAVKLGVDGGMVRSGEESVRAPRIHGEVVDTIGAGDSFDAGFVFGVVRGWSSRRALALANACGGLSCRAVGGVDGQATLEEALAHVPPAGPGA
jgi:sugar/nucleoside kinase (ribokinase family)